MNTIIITITIIVSAMNLLSDSSKFKKLGVKPGKEINFMLQQEKRLINFFKKVKRSISELLYKRALSKRFTSWYCVWFI